MFQTFNAKQYSDGIAISAGILDGELKYGGMISVPNLEMLNWLIDNLITFYNSCIPNDENVPKAFQDVLNEKMKE